MEDNYPLKINIVEDKEIDPEVITNNELIYLVTYDNKGLSETNFIATKTDLIKEIGMDDDFFNSFVGDVNQRTYYVAANKTYDIWLCKSVEQLADFLNGKYNTDIQELIWNNFEEGEYDGSYDDWYWRNGHEWCSKEALDIAKLYALNTDNLDYQRTILKELCLITVSRQWLSVTQGAVDIKIGDKTVVRYADDIWFYNKSQNKYVNGFETKSAEEIDFFKETSDGWGSIKSDDVFIKAVLEQFPDRVKDALMETIDGKYTGFNKYISPELRDFMKDCHMRRCSLIKELDKKTLDSIVNNAESRKMQTSEKNTKIFDEKEI